ncbi:MAG: RNA polymerase factor sigma-54 [Armatimonadota bacterium]|nr:RNA polymerase factor sigma-54 [Armatimonadota bacterium]
MRIEQGLRQAQTQRIDPKMILANQVLQLTSLELQQAIEQELAENPALEVSEDDPCQGCDTPKSLCIDCAFQKQAVSSDDVDLSVHEFETTYDFSGDNESEGDFIGNIQAEITLADHLRELYRAVAPEASFDIGEYLISNIGETGYLETTIEEAAKELQITEEEVAAALSILQSLDPPGVGARDLQECLGIQIEQLAEEDQGNTVALAMVRTCWQDMLGHKYGRIARKLKVPVRAVHDAADFIKRKLNPYPGNAFRMPWNNKPDSTRASIKPDVVIKRTPTGYEIEVMGNEQFFLAVNSYYNRMNTEMRNPDAKGYTEQDKKHVFEFVERADLFIKNINQRRKTLRLISKGIIDQQQGYLETGSRSFLRPLTRTRIAHALSMHESTVSRATSNKYVQLPNQEVVSFDFFFDGSLSVKDMIGQMIATEDAHNPLSDQTIAEMLQARGLNIARRTVVKYREAQKILSSRQRRR